MTEPLAAPVAQVVAASTQQTVPVPDLVAPVEEGTQPAMTMLSPLLLI